jgi:O-succinylbenzoate synthase
MQIDSIDIYHVALPYRVPQSTPWGLADSLQTVLVRMESGGVAGWGEASPGSAPAAGAEWAGGVFLCLRDWLAPRVVGGNVETGDQLHERLDAVRGNRFAKAALDMAWWDLHARLRGQPLHRVLGGDKQAVEVGVSFDRTDSIDEFLDSIGRAFSDGYGRVELKFRPGWDVQMINTVRHVYPSERIHIDVEGGLTLGYMELLCRLDDFCLAMVEQPLPADDLVGHAMVQETVRTPICLDESITTLAQAEMALELHSAKYINLKPGRVGGLTTALAIHDACHPACIPCWVGGMPQSVIGVRHGLALAAKPNCSYPADHIPADSLFQVDLADPLLPVRESAEDVLRIPLWSAPGIGIEPQADVLEKHLLARARIA